MRELSEDEIESVSGGNLTMYAFNSIQVASAFATGFTIGEGINFINQNYSNMSLGEAIYRTVN